MEHKKYKEWLQLVIAKEITPDQRQLLDTHLRECDECRTELQELEQLMVVLGQRGAPEPSGQLLWEARRGLGEAIRREPSIQSVLTHVTPGAAPVVSKSIATQRSSGFLRNGLGALFGYRIALSSLATVVFGIFVGYLAFGRAGAPAQLASVAQAPIDPVMADHEMGRADIANVRFVESGTDDGKIAIEYDLVRPVRLAADIDDRRMQRLLAYALVNEENPGVRLQAISELKKETRPSPASDVKSAMIEAIKTDPNVGVRRQALRFLGTLRLDGEIKDACLHVLIHDKNPGMRVASIHLLAEATMSGAISGDEVYDVLMDELKKDDDEFLRAQTAAFIQEVSDVQ